MLRRTTAAIVLLFCCGQSVAAAPAAAPVQVRQVPLTLPYDDRRHNMLFRGRPAAELQPTGLTRTEPSVVLENDYLRVTVLPGHGGVIESAQFKPLGCELFARERRFRHLWPYWESGVKVSFPFHEHGGCLIDQPASCRVVRGEDGSATAAMWMEFSRWNYDANAVAWRTDRAGRKREPCLLPAKDSTPKNMYSNLLLSQLVTLRPGEAAFSITYRLVNPTPYRVGRKIWNDTFLPRIHTKAGEFHGRTHPPPGRQATELVLPTVHVSNHGGRDFRVWDRSEMVLDNAPAAGNTLFAWEVPVGFAGLWYPQVRINRLRLTDPNVAPGTKLYWQGYRPNWDANAPQANLYNALELWGGADNVFEGTENWIGPGEAWQFTHRYTLIAGIGKADYADANAAVHVQFGGAEPRIEVVTLRKVAQLSASLEAEPLGSARPCAPDRPARFALPADANGGRVRLSADGKVLFDGPLPLKLAPRTARYGIIRASLTAAPENIEKANCGTNYGRQLYRTALRSAAFGTAGRGRVLLRDGQLAAAVECLAQATASDANDGEGWHLLGAALLEQDKDQEAARAFARAVRAARAYPPARYYLAVLAIAAGKRDAAGRELRALLDAQPDHFEAALLWAWLRAQDRATVQEALGAARKLAAGDPADPRAAWVLLQCLRAAGADAADQEPALQALLKEAGAARRLEEFTDATRGRYLPCRRIGYPPR